MKRKSIRFLTAVIAGAMLCVSLRMDLWAMENPGVTAGEEENIQEETAASNENTDEWRFQQAQKALEQLAEQRELVATLYRTDNYPLTAAAGSAVSALVKIPSGSQLLIRGVEIQDKEIWYLVSYTKDEINYMGYVQGGYLISTDERFLDWQSTYLTGGESGTGEDSLVKASDDILAFPESYRSYLSQLKSQHPNWVFVPFNTNLNWNTVIAQEMKGDRSWVHSSKPAAWRGEQRASGWYLATQEAVEYCVDPRNFLNEKYIFMFEQLTFNGNCHTVQGVQNIIQNTFMRGEIPGEGISYAQNFYNIGQGLGVSPFHLASRVYQEQGVGGTSSLISGTYPGYEGYYNYFNISASGTTDQQVIESGLKYAQSKGWNSRVKSIAGGAEFISKNYILKGQDTLYLQKFDVDPSYHGLYSHQYMQNITAPMTEGATTRAAYEKAGALNNTFVFKIPVYLNMPASPCPEPGTSNVINPTEEQKQQLRAFIIRLYVNALGRSSYAEEEIDYWYQKLISRESAGAQVAYGFFFSEEFKGKGLSDEEYLEVLYKVMFDRMADADGEAYWLEKLEIGMSREYVYAGFANSNEFSQVCSNFGVDRGTISWTAYRDQNEGVTAFVTRLYNKALGRRGDDDGMETWPKAILQKEKTVEEVAYGFIFSPEFMNKHYGNEQYIQILYRTFMDREYDSEGLIYWMDKLNAGVTRETVFRGFARSPEFSEIMEEYGITPY